MNKLKSLYLLVVILACTSINSEANIIPASPHAKALVKLIKFPGSYHARVQAGVAWRVPGASVENIYARQELVISDAGTSSGANNYYSFQEVSLTLKFYSDEACTQPYTLAAPLDFKIDAFGFYEYLNDAGFYPHYNIEGTVPSGVSEYLVDESLPFDDQTIEYSNGEMVYLNRSAYDYDLISVECNYIAISPVVYPSHPF